MSASRILRFLWRVYFVSFALGIWTDLWARKSRKCLDNRNKNENPAKVFFPVLVGPAYIYIYYFLFFFRKKRILSPKVISSSSQNGGWFLRSISSINQGYPHFRKIEKKKRENGRVLSWHQYVYHYIDILRCQYIDWLMTLICRIMSTYCSHFPRDVHRYIRNPKPSLHKYTPGKTSSISSP